MPPVLFVVLSTPMTKLAHLIFPTAVANGVISGAFTFCMCPYFVCCAFPPLTAPPQMLFTMLCIMRKSASLPCLMYLF